MIEIAICLAIVAFAMVAIMGVLPMGLQVQKTNREETIITLDGAYFLEAIRGGSYRIDDLTNYVDWIRLTNYSGTGPPTVVGLTNPMTGWQLMGLLSTPKYRLATNGLWQTNFVRAKVRALSGSAIEKTGALKDFGFSYLLDAEVIPFKWSALRNLPPLGTNQTPAQYSQRLQATNLANATYEVRLTLRWPVRPNGTPGLERQVFRTLVTGRLYQDTNWWSALPTLNGGSWFPYFFQPSVYGH